MGRYTNPSGYIKYDTEEQLCQELEKYFLPYFFDGNWKPELDITKEIPVNGHSKKILPKYQKRIDYYGKRNKTKIYLEVKNWFIKDKDIRQILEYYNILKERNKKFVLLIICGGIYPEKLINFLDKNIAVLLTKNIPELNPEEVVYWM